MPVLFISSLFIFFAVKTAAGNEMNNQGYNIMKKAWDAYRIPGSGEVEELEIFTFKSSLNYNPEQARKNIDGRNVFYKKARRQIKYFENENKIRVTFDDPQEVRHTDFIFIHSIIHEDLDKIWGWFPAFRRVRRIAPMDGQFMDTVLHYDELARRFNGENLDNFKITLLGEEKIGGKNCYKISLMPKKEIADDTPYICREFWVQKEGLSAFLQVKYYYNEEYGGHIKIQRNFGITKFLFDFWRVSYFVMTEYGKKENFTSIIVFNKREQKELNENIFDPKVLERGK